MNGQQAQTIEKAAGGEDVMHIGFKLLSENAKLPTKANLTDSGLDIYAAADIVIQPGETVIVPTDLAIQLPRGYEAVVRPRSGITSKTKLRVQIGTIDESYRGNIGIMVDNIRPYYEGLQVFRYAETIDGQDVRQEELYDKGTYLIRKGDKIAQLVVQRIPTTVAVEIAEIGDTARGDNGFGSSGV